jgi:Ni/Fe-hydrogenase subunit HybB-like protein
MRELTPSTPARRWIVDKLLVGLAPRDYLRSLLTWGNGAAGLILAIGLPIIVYRFAYGLGAVTNLSQSMPWGLWVGLDVVSGVALAAGGYTIASAVYLFGLRDYHLLVRPAILTGFLGYLFVVLGLLVDLGRPWKLPVPIVYSFGTTSVMFEVSWCVLMYTFVLAIECLPPLFEWLGWSRARQRAVRLTIGATVFGVVLSTLHQSSLGAMFLMAPTKLHPLWYSPYIPVFFFVSSISAGLSMVLVESSLSSRAFPEQIDGHHRRALDRVTLGLGRAAAVVLFTLFFLRLQGVAASHGWSLLATGWGGWFLVEVLGFILAPCAVFAWAVRREDVRLVRMTAAWTVAGVVLNRLNVSMVAFNWNAAERYVPSFGEIMTSVTIITLGVLVFRFVVNRMPVLHEHPAYADEPSPSATGRRAPVAWPASGRVH